MWNQNEGAPAPENIDNYLSAIQRAKDEIAVLNKDIAEALKRKSDLISGNDILLKEKIAEHDAKLDSLNTTNDQAENLKAEHARNLADLVIREKSLQDNIASLETKKAELASQIEAKTTEFEAREQDIKKFSDDVSAKSQDVEKMLIHNAEILDQSNKAAHDAELAMLEANSAKTEAQRLNDETSKKLADAKILKEEADDSKKNEVDNLNEATKQFQAAIKMKEEVDSTLQTIIAEKNAINDRIIESKKAALEASQLIETSKKTIVEANQKIAELTALKEALAKQEK